MKKLSYRLSTLQRYSSIFDAIDLFLKLCFSSGSSCYSLRWRSKLCTLALCGVFLFSTMSPVIAAPIAVLAPIIVAVSPTHVYNDQEVEITITGAGFVATPVITASTCNAGLVVLSNVSFVNSTTLTATVPAGLVEGIYILAVINPDGQSGYYYSGLTIQRRGDIHFGPWKTTAQMTTVRWRFSSVIANGHVYALGGNGRDSSVILSSIERAKIGPDGSLGPWQFAGALTTPRASFAAVVAGNYIYALGGEGGVFGLNSSSVERAIINSDGSLGSWQVISYMIEPRYGLAAVVTGGYLYVLGGYPGLAPPMNTVERAELKSDGSLGPWELTTSMTIPRSKAVAVGGYIYALGFDNSIERAMVNADGSLQPWEIISAMTTERKGSEFVVVDGHLYVLGGFYGCIYSTNSVERAVINDDGSLGSWQLTASMLVGRSDFGAVATENAIYALGGMINWGGGDPRNVEYAEIRSNINYHFLPLLILNESVR